MWNYLAAGLLLAPLAQATAVTPLLDLPPQRQQVQLMVKNDGAQPQTYVLSVDETTFPDGRVRVIAPSSPAVKLEPARFTLGPGQRRGVAVSYAGPKPENERYFVIRVGEQSPRQQISYALELTSRLFVRPAKPALKYHFDGAELRNESNAFVMVMMDEDCGKTEGPTRLLGPGQSFRLPTPGSGSQVSLGFIDKVTTLLDRCADIDKPATRP